MYVIVRITIEIQYNFDGNYTKGRKIINPIIIIVEQIKKAMLSIVLNPEDMQNINMQKRNNEMQSSIEKHVFKTKIFF